MKFHTPDCLHNRSFIVDGIPGYVPGYEGSDKIIVNVTYSANSNSNLQVARALDGHVMPVLVNAMKMKEMLQTIADHEHFDAFDIRKIKALLKEMEGPPKYSYKEDRPERQD